MPIIMKMMQTLLIHPTNTFSFFNPVSAVEGIKSVPSVRPSISVTCVGCTDPFGHATWAFLPTDLICYDVNLFAALNNSCLVISPNLLCLFFLKIILNSNTNSFSLSLDVQIIVLTSSNNILYIHLQFDLLRHRCTPSRISSLKIIPVS